MSEQMDIIIRTATVDDAEAILTFAKQVGGETDNLTFGERGVSFSLEQEEWLLREIQASLGQLILVAVDPLSAQIVGMLSITNEAQERVQHVGEMGVSVLKAYWGFGIGRLLVEEGIAWAKASGVLRRLELDVRVDNQRAIALYLHAGFTFEGCLRQAICVRETYYDVYRMALLFDE